MDELVAKTWHKIQQEAECMAAQEPMLASFFHSTILNHKNLRSALSFQLANKLDSATMPAIALREVIELALRSEPELLTVVAADICAVQERDPAVESLLHPAALPQGVPCPAGLSGRQLAVASGAPLAGPLSAKPNLGGVRG